MNDVERTPAGMALTDAILDLFRLNSRLAAAGDRLVGGLGLTTARWQVLGAIVYSDRPQPVAWLARDLGGNRQNVQRIVNDLSNEGLVAFAPNPHHRRAQLVVLTDKGGRPSTRPCDCRLRGSTDWSMASLLRTSRPHAKRSGRCASDSRTAKTRRMIHQLNEGRLDRESGDAGSHASRI